MFEIGSNLEGFLLLFCALLSALPVIFIPWLEWWHRALFLIMVFLFAYEGFPLLIRNVRLFVDTQQKTVKNVLHHVETDFHFREIFHADIEDVPAERTAGVGDYDEYRIFLQFKNKKKFYLLDTEHDGYLHFFQLARVAQRINDLLGVHPSGLRMDAIRKHLEKKKHFITTLVVIYLILLVFGMTISYPRNIPAEILYT